MNKHLPVIIIGAGPVGLAAAAHLIDRRIQPLILEAGACAGSGITRWSGVRMFSPWHYSIDSVAARLLSDSGWIAPPADGFPTGAELIEGYLRPLAATPQIAATLRCGAKVTAVTRAGRDLMSDAAREQQPFLVRYLDQDGEHELLARAVIDASGTIEQPNPLGASGIAALGEAAAAERIHYGIPDVLGADRDRYVGQRVLVVGSGHSAFNVLNDLAEISRTHPATEVHWATRRKDLRRVLGGGEHDQLIERGKLGIRIGALLNAGIVKHHAGFRLQRIRPVDGALAVDGGNAQSVLVDQIIGCTGYRPQLAPLAELRIALDPSTQSTPALAPLIDPNLHSCGSVRPHGAEELKHPEKDFYIVGMKSYGRAPTFLLATGYEQVRSVVAAIDGDWEAARRVELKLPETGVCITQFGDECLAHPANDSCCTGTDPCACGTRTPSNKASCCG